MEYLIEEKWNYKVLDFVQQLINLCAWIAFLFVCLFTIKPVLDTSSS